MQAASSVSQSSKSSLLLDIQQLATQENTFITKINQLKVQGVSEEWISRLISPEMLIHSNSMALRERKTKPLQPDDPLFQPLHQLMAEIKSKLLLQLTNCELLQDILQIYESFIQQVCTNEGRARSRLLKGSVLLEGYTVGKLLVSQQLGRQLASIDPYGETVQLNRLGSSAVQKVGNTYYKRARYNPLAPGHEFLFNSFLSLITNQGSPPTLLLKVSNIWARIAFCESNRGHPSRNQLQHELTSSGESIPAIFSRLPDLKEHYPFFAEERRAYLIQASKSVEGENLHYCLRGSSSAASSVSSSESGLIFAQQLNPTSFTLQVIFALLFRLSDARADNYIVTPDKNLFLIDADPLFEPPFHQWEGRHDIQMRTILFLLPNMNDQLDKEAMATFLKATSNLDQFFIDWLVGIQKRNSEYQTQLEGGFLSQEEMDELSLPISLSYSNFHTLYQQIEKIHTLQNQSSSLNHWDLFTCLYPVMSRAYRRLSQVDTTLSTHRSVSPSTSSSSSSKTASTIVEHIANPSPISVQNRLFSKKALTIEEVFGSEFASLREELSKEAVVSTPPLLLPALLQHWLQDGSQRSAKKQRRLIEHILPLTGSLKLPLSQTALDDRDLHYLVNRFKLDEISLDNAPQVTALGLMDLLSENPTLRLTLGRLPHLSAGDFAEIISFHQRMGKSCHFLIENERHPITEEPTLLFKLLLAKEFNKVESLVKIGMPCNVERLGTDFLHKLAEKEVPEAIGFLRSQGYPSNLKNSRGQTPLHIAARAGCVNTLPLLITESQSIDEPDLEGRTPMHLATMQGHLATVTKLLELNGNMFLTTGEQESLLHLAAFYGHATLLTMLLQRGLIGLINAGDHDCKTPLHRAVWSEPKPEIVKILLDAGAIVDIQNNFGYTPLHWAAKHGHLESARDLLERGADFSILNDNHKSPLDLAIDFGQDAVVRLFLNPEVYPTMEESDQVEVDTSDLEGSYYSAFERAYEAGDVIRQILYLEKIAVISLQKEDFMKTVHLLNAALAIAQKKQINAKYQEFLLNRLETIEGMFLQKMFGVKTPPGHRNYIMSYRHRLRELRKGASRRFSNNEPVEAVQLFISKGYKAILRSLVEESIHLIGTAPPTSFAFMGLGSLAREEACPNSDVEFAILVAEENPGVLNYFRGLSSLLELRITNLGETKFDLVRPKRIEGVVTEAASLTPNGFSMDIGGLSPRGKTGVYELIGTPQRLAAFQNPVWLQRNEGEIILVNALTSVSRIFGNDQLIKKYAEEMKRWLDQKQGAFLNAFGGTTQRHTRALSLLQGHAAEFRPYLTEDRLGIRAFDVKKDLYRPLQMAIQGLLLYHGLNNQSTLQGIESLRKKKILSSTGAKNLSDALVSILNLRMQTHLFYQTEKEIVYFSRGEGDVEARGLFLMPKGSKQIVDIYKVLIPLHQAMQGFLRGDKKALYNATFLDETVGTYTGTHAENFQWDAAESSSAQAGALNPEDPEVLQNLANVKSQLDKAKDALKYLQESLRILQQQHGDNPHPDIATTLNNLGRACADSGDDIRALTYYEQSLAMKKLIYGDKPDASISTTLCNLGAVNVSLSNGVQAVGYLEQGLAMQKLLHCDKPHLDIAGTLGFLGSAYAILGDLTRAIDCAEQSLAMKKLIYRKKPHPAIAAALSNLGRAYLEFGDVKRAFDYLKSSLAMSKLIYSGKPHSSIASALSGLGKCYGFQGDATRAIRYYERSLAMSKLIYGDKPHPDVAAILDELGSVYHGLLNDEIRAIGYFEQSLVMSKLIYGDKPHPLIARTLDNLGLAYGFLGDITQGISYLGQSLAMMKLVFGDKPHPGIAKTLLNLAFGLEILYKKCGELENAIQAIGYYKQSLTMFLETKGYDHPDTKEAKDNLETLGSKIATSLDTQGLAYRDSNSKASRAIGYYEQSLTIKKLINDDKPHPDIATTLNNLGIAYKTMGDTTQAIRYFEESLAMRKLIYGDKPHADTAFTLSYLGCAYYELSDASQAIGYYEQALAMYKLIYDDKSHPDIVNGLMNLGYTHRHFKNPGKATEYFDEALTIYGQIHEGKPHLTIAQTLNYLGAAYRELGDFEKAIDYCIQSLNMKISLYGDIPHGEIAFTLNSLGKGYKMVGDRENALKSHEKAYEIYRKLRGEDHPDTKEAFESLQQIRQIQDPSVSTS